MEVIEAGFSIVVVAAVAQGVDLRQGAFCGNDLAVGVVFVAGDNISVGIDDLHHIALQVGDVVIGGAVVLYRIGNAAGIVEEIEGVAAVGLPQQLAAGVVISVDNTVDGFRGADTVVVVSIGDVGVTAACADQVPAFRPGECPAGAVKVADGVAADRVTCDRIAADGLALVGDGIPLYAVSRSAQSAFP